MQARCTPRSAGTNLSHSWLTAGAPLTPESIAGTFAAQPPLIASEEDQFTREGQNNLPPLASLRFVRCFPEEGYVFGCEVVQ